MSWRIKHWERLIWVSLLLCVFVVQVKVPGLKEGVEAKESEDSGKYLNIFTKTLQQIRLRYVDSEKVTYKKLIYGAIKGMLNELEDPHTSFLDPETLNKLREGTKGSFFGIGIYIKEEEDYLTVVQPIDGTPAAEVGLKHGDIISEIEGEETYGKGIEDAVSKIKGPKGSTVNITVVRDGEVKPLRFKITRDEIKIKSVVYDMIEDSKTGYIKVHSFSETTAIDMKRFVKDLKQKEMDSLIIDLRYNPGGLLHIVEKAVDLFIDEGLIVYTKDRSGQSKHSKQASKNIILPKYIPIIVLINKYSASASEIFAGALQDHKRAILMGEKTFGKFSVQEIIPVNIPDNTAFKMTIAKYYLPSGRSLHEKGIVPDIEVSANYLTHYERKVIGKEKAQTIIKNYAKKYPSPEDDKEHIGEIMSKLSDEDLNISQATVNFFVDQERNKKIVPAKYDTRYDNQLKEAMTILKSHQIFNHQK